MPAHLTSSYRRHRRGNQPTKGYRTMSTQTTGTAVTDTDEDRALKARHAAMWALGNYPVVATDLIGSLGPVLVEAAGITAGQRVHDVAAGSGNVAIPAARRGAQVTASDLTPELLAKGRKDAEAEGLDITWQVADAEALPCDDGRVRRRDLVRRHHVRPAPPGGGRRAAAAVSAPAAPSACSAGRRKGSSGRCSRR